MSSVEIAELVGKRHSDVLEAIRNMEPAWEKVSQRKFSLASYTDAQGKKRPCYFLDKRECLYIATKFKDEARAKLVLRWEELETKERTTMTVLPDFTNPAEAARSWAEQYEQRQIEAKRADEAEAQVLSLTQEIESMQPKVSYYDTILANQSTVVITQIEGLSLCHTRPSARQSQVLRARTRIYHARPRKHQISFISFISFILSEKV